MNETINEYPHVKYHAQLLILRDIMFTIDIIKRWIMISIIISIGLILIKLGLYIGQFKISGIIVSIMSVISLLCLVILSVVYRMMIKRFNTVSQKFKNENKEEYK